MVKIGRLDDSFLEVFFLTTSKPSRRPITVAKRKGEKNEKTKTKTKTKIEEPKDIATCSPSSRPKF